MKNIKIVSILLSIVSFIVSGFFGYKGYDKITNYNNPEFGFDYVNAYVGSDAANFTINAQYATAYFTLSTLFVILGTGLLIISLLAHNKATEANTIQSLETDNTITDQKFTSQK